jgi:hypothetical protein
MPEQACTFFQQRSFQWFTTRVYGGSVLLAEQARRFCKLLWRTARLMLELTRTLVADVESGAYSQSGALGTALYLSL